MIWLIVAGILFLFISFKLIGHFYFISVDNTLFLSGPPGTGKTLTGVNEAFKLLKSLKIRVWIHNFKQKFVYIPKRTYWEKPQLYSNIPLRVGKLKKKAYKKKYEEVFNKYDGDEAIIVISHKYSNTFDYWFTMDHYDEILKSGRTIIEVTNDKFCNILKPDHVLEKIRLPYRSVKFITEIGKVASQYDWNNPNVKEHINDWVSMDRQYTHGGYIVMDDQSSDNVAVPIRRRVGTVINCLHFRSFWKFYWQQMRNITISEDIKTQETDSVEDNMKTHIGMFPFGKPKYDTYAFDGRYHSVPFGDDVQFLGYKTNEMIEIPDVHEYTYKGQLDMVMKNDGDYQESILTKKDVR